MSRRPRRAATVVVAVGGLDPSCGAGITADVRTLDALGVAPATVVTAITVQAGSGVDEVAAVAPGLVGRQLRKVLEDLPVQAVKCGLLPVPATVGVVAEILASAGLPLVLDPVVEAGAGGRLASAGVPRAVVAELLPLSSVVTVNLDEAALLTGGPVGDEAAMHAAARRLVELGARAAVVKGGHLGGRPVDVSWDGRCARRYEARRIGRGDVHGTGCAFASAVAAGLAHGRSLAASVVVARRHVRALIASARPTGSGALLRQPPRPR